MSFIYDIVLNFNKEIYNFYDWNREDNIELYLKIPIFKIENDIIRLFYKNDFTVDKEFLSLIKSKTTKYSSKKSKIVKYSSLFVSEEICLAVLFDENGRSIKKSLLGIDEETEIIDYSKTLKYKLFNYKIIETKKNKNNYLTRKEIKDKKEMINLLKDIYNKKEENKLNYIFYEVYNEKMDDINKGYLKLMNLIENNSSKLSSLYNILLSIKKVNALAPNKL